MAVIDQIKDIVKTGQKNKWYETYWAFDIHGTILKPNYDLNQPVSEDDFYPYAKEVLQILTKRDDVRLIMWTCSYPHEIKDLKKLFAASNIKFDYICENPEISSSHGHFGYYNDKFYFNILFEDKAGFRPHELKEIHEYLVYLNENGPLPDPKWSNKY